MSVNLMTEQAQFRVAAERIVRGWVAGVAALVLAMLPLAAWTWSERRQVVREHTALEAAYEPIRRLAGANRTLGAKAAGLVTREQTPLELSRAPSTVAVLARVADAVAQTAGAVYVEHFVLTQDVAPADRPEGARRLTIDFVSSLGFDISRLAKTLDGPPFIAVKTVSSESINDADIPRKKHVIECEF